MNSFYMFFLGSLLFIFSYKSHLQQFNLCIHIKGLYVFFGFDSFNKLFSFSANRFQFKFFPFIFQYFLQQVSELSIVIFVLSQIFLIFFSNLYSIMIIKQKKAKFLFNFCKKLYYSFAFDHKKDYFKTLGLQKSASEVEIKSAYYKLALKYHPDHNKGTETTFKQINQAYTVLSNLQLKKQYESLRENQSQTFRENYQSPFREERRNRWNNDHQEFWERRNYRYRGKFTEEEFQRYQKFRAQYEQAQRQSFRKWQESNEKQADQSFENMPKQSKRIIAQLKGSFIAGLVISLVFLIPQALINKSRAQNEEYGYKNTEKGRYPFKNVDPAAISADYRNSYSSRPENTQRY